MVDEGNWQGIMATVSDALVSYNDKGEILLWNQAAEEDLRLPGSGGGREEH